MNDDSMRPVQPQPLINKVSLPATRLVTAMAVTAVLFLVVPAASASPNTSAATSSRMQDAETSTTVAPTTTADQTGSSTTTAAIEVDEGAPASPNEGSASPKTVPAILLFASAVIVLAVCARLYRVRRTYTSPGTPSDDSEQPTAPESP